MLTMTPVTKMTMTMTLDDLRLAALVVLRLGDPNRKIQSIKTLRDLVKDITPVNDDGSALTAWCDCADRGEPCNTPCQTIVKFGLRECKEAIDAWFEGTRFIG